MHLQVPQYTRALFIFPYELLNSFYVKYNLKHVFNSLSDSVYISQFGQTPANSSDFNSMFIYYYTLQIFPVRLIYSISADKLPVRKFKNCQGAK